MIVSFPLSFPCYSPRVNRDTGMITLKRGAPKGAHEFQVEVTDSESNAVISTVKVYITYIEEEHVRTSASMRLSGMHVTLLINKWLI